MSDMRAKMTIIAVRENKSNVEGETPELISEDLEFMAVGPSEMYPEDGSDENNTYARYTPSASLTMTIQNPGLFGKFKNGDTFYLDFTKAQ